VKLAADLRLVADFDPKKRRWVVPAGTYTLVVGQDAGSTSLSATTKLAAATLKP
jgi:hypothetical protein